MDEANSPKPMDLRTRLTDLVRAVGRPELVDRIAADVPPMYFALTPELPEFGNLFELLDRDGYRHTLAVWNVGQDVATELQLFSLIATHPDNRNQYVVLTEHDITHPIVMGAVLLAAGTDEVDGALSREDALRVLTELDKRTIPAPQRGMTEMAVHPAPQTPLPPTVAFDPPAWRRAVVDWASNPQNDDFTSVAEVARKRADLIKAADVARRRAELGIWSSDRPFVGVYQDGRPATIVVMEESWDLLAGRTSTTGGGKSKPEQVAAVIAAAGPDAQVFVRYAKDEGATEWSGTPWPTAAYPGGPVMTEFGEVPGCVRGTCTHARMGHDVEDDEDPVPRCGADGCDCGRLTPAIVRSFPEYYIAGGGQQRASEVQCRHTYNLTDTCPGCDLDHDNEERIAGRLIDEWLPELVADIRRVRKHRGDDSVLLVADVVDYVPPSHQAAAIAWYGQAWWGEIRPFPKPPAHVCVPGGCGCCPGCGDGCGHCDGIVPCSPGFKTCVMPNGHEGECIRR